MNKVELKAGEEKFFPVHSFVAFHLGKAKLAHAFAEEHGDPGPFMVMKNQGYPPGHNLYQKDPQMITIAVKGELIRLPGSSFAPY